MIVVYCECGAKSTPRKWRQEGWLKMDVTYANGGGKRTFYTCAKCRKIKQEVKP